MANDYLTLREMQYILDISYPTALKIIRELDDGDAKKSGNAKTSGWEISRDAIQNVLNQERRQLEAKQKRLNDVQ